MTATNTVRVTEFTRKLRDGNDDGFNLQAWKIERLTGFGACFADGQDRWTHTATVTLYTDGVYGIARANREDQAHTTDQAAAMTAAKRL